MGTATPSLPPGWARRLLDHLHKGGGLHCAHSPHNGVTPIVAVQHAIFFKGLGGVVGVVGIALHGDTALRLEQRAATSAAGRAEARGARCRRSSVARDTGMTSA